MQNRNQLIAAGCSAIVCVLFIVSVLWPAQPQVTGLVMLDDRALPGATVLFYPANEAGDVDGEPGFAMTDEAGIYTVFEPLSPGTYSVVVRPPARLLSTESQFSEFDSVQREAMLAGRSTKQPPAEFLAGFIAVSGSRTVDGDFMIESVPVGTPEKLAGLPSEPR